MTHEIWRTQLADCANLPKCPFFYDKMQNMPSMADMYKENYCRGDNSHCARFIVMSRLGAGAVPSDLFPNQVARADQLLDAAM